MRVRSGDTAERDRATGEAGCSSVVTASSARPATSEILRRGCIGLTGTWRDCSAGLMAVRGGRGSNELALTHVAQTSFDHHLVQRRQRAWVVTCWPGGLPKRWALARPGPALERSEHRASPCLSTALRTRSDVSAVEEQRRREEDRVMGIGLVGGGRRAVRRANCTRPVHLCAQCDSFR